MMKLIRIVVLFLSILLVFASSGLAGPKPVGDYLVSEFQDEVSQGPIANDPWIALMSINLDGQGKGTYEDLYVSSGDKESGTFNYSVRVDGLLKMIPPAPDEDYFMPGAVSSDGKVFALAHTGRGERGISFGIKKPSGGSPPVVTNRPYLMAQFSDDVSNPGQPGQVANEPWASLSLITLNANGTGTYDDLYASDGDTSDSGTFDYTLDAAGNLTITVTIPGEGSFSFHGIVSEDGSLFTLADTLPNEPGIMVGIKKSSGGMSKANLKGKYLMADFDDEIERTPEPVANEPWASLMEINLDGQGNGTFRDLYTSDNDPQLESGSITYSVTPSGELTITHPGGTVHGIVSSDGNVFILANTIIDVPGITIGIKKSPMALPALQMLLLED